MNYNMYVRKYDVVDIADITRSEEDTEHLTCDISIHTRLRVKHV